MSIWKDKILLVIVGASLIYWLYLTAASTMALGGDALGYQQLGESIRHEGWVHYWKTGPNREPIYPALIAFSMLVSDTFGCGYQKALTIVQVLLLLITQVTVVAILSLLKIHRRIIAITMVYIAVSPALINSTFSLYSEIAAVPLTVITLFLLLHWQQAIEHQRRVILVAAGIGVMFGALVLVKAAFEVIAPVIIVLVGIVFGILYCHNRQAMKKVIASLALSLVVFLSIVNIYKAINYHYNGNYVVTDRASWALYGNTMRRMEPVNEASIKAAIFYVAGEGVCHRFSTPQECYRWSFSHSDDIGMPKYTQMMRAGLTVKEADKIVITDSLKAIMHNPIQYAFFCVLEGMKMFFWESTQIGFVQYPAWLASIYDNALISDGIRAVIFLMTFGAVCLMVIQLMQISLMKRQAQLLMLIFMLSFIAVYPLFYILTRYALPIAPILLIIVAQSVNSWIKNDSKNI